MKLSAHNVFDGTVTEVKKSTTTAHVVIDVKGLPVWAVITNESLDHLGLKPRVPAKAIIKATEVVVGVD
jgi:molybdopterin-binding protein